MPTHALIFDFDGLILDTETPEYQAWQEIYQEFGCHLPIATWGQIVGGNGSSAFDPVDYLESQVGRQLDRAGLIARRHARDHEIIAASPPLPGVVDYLTDARRAGLRLAVASSSPHAWVDTHLTRLGLFDRFDAILCVDDVGVAKPDPRLFLRAVEVLGIEKREALIFEDSPNGVLAAKRAGIFCVAVPNPVTSQLTFDPPDLRLNSLAEIPLKDLLQQVEEKRAI
ncbi:MAG: HAD family hydrolase [Anaerolineales bacterium]